MIRRGEEDFGLQGMGDVLMRRELLSVVEGDGVLSGVGISLGSRRDIVRVAGRW